MGKEMNSYWLGGFRVKELAEEWKRKLEIEFPQDKFTVGVAKNQKIKYWRHYVAVERFLSEEETDRAGKLWADVAFQRVDRYLPGRGKL